MTAQDNTIKSINSLAIPIAIVMLFVSAIALFSAVSYENKRFYHEQVNLAKSSVQSVQYNLSQYIENKKSIVQSMIDNNREILLDLVNFPDDNENYSYFLEQVENRLKNSYSFSLTDSNGIPILTKKGIIAQHPERPPETIIIHGSTAKSYHIDIMARIKKGAAQSPILFVSLNTSSLVDILNISQVPQQKIFIVDKNKPENIEISDAGIQFSSLNNSLSTKVLSKKTLDSVMYQVPLTNTGWLILAIPEELLFSDYKTLLINRALLAYLCLLIIIVFFVWRLRYEEKSRKVAEDNLTLSYKLLTAEVKLQTQELSDSKQYLESLFISAPYGLLVTNENGIINSINKQAEKIFEYPHDELIGQSIEILIPKKQRNEHITYRKNFVHSSKSRKIGIERELKGLRKNGREFPVTIALNTITSNNEKIVIASINDITELVSIQHQLRDEHERAIVTLSSIGDAVITTSIDGIIDSINAMAEKLTGWNSIDAIGEHISNVFCAFDEITRDKRDDPIIRCLKKSRQPNSEQNDTTVLMHKKGLDIPIEDNVSAIYNKEGQFSGIVLVFHDVSQSRQHAHEIEFQANHDALTCLLNRRKFDVYLTNALINARETNSHYVLLYMDLDRFKLVNDTAGHAAGDELLKQLTRTLTKTLRQRDIFARLGGDEFGILLAHCSSDDGYAIANKVLDTVNDFRFFWKKDVFSVGVSIGMIAFSSTEDTADKILNEADAACYTAKENGRSRIQIYDEHAAQKLNESHIINMLTYAFENDQMRLYQQKILSVSNKNDPGHYEILIRMFNDGNIIPPGMFLPAAERYGLAITLDRWVIRSVFKWLSENQSKFSPIPVLAINLSGQSITDSLFSSFIKEQFQQYNIDPANICFEITETAAMYNLDVAKDFIHSLKKMGCQFSLDDFGSGHASYSQLKHLPVDYLKIDGSLVKDILDDPIDFSIVKSINDVGHILGMKTIAEFVENDQIAEKLANINIDYIQGYGIARPTPIDDLITEQ